MNENERIIEKIKKLMAIANDPSASDQEIQLSAYKANKLMIQHKIKEIDIYGTKKNNNVVHERLEMRGSGYIIWVLNILSKHFRCKSSFIGKINRNDCIFIIWGLKEDVDILKPVAEGIIYYLNNNLDDLKACYIAAIDFRVFKREYLHGFSIGLDTTLQKVLIDMNIDKKYELAIVGVPAVVESLYESKVRQTKVSYSIYSYDAYNLGIKDGRKYDIEKKHLLQTQ